MANLLALLWLIRTTKVNLFYVYLWQLKQYRWGRFRDHFRTEKGKQLIFGKENIMKAGLLAGFIYFGGYWWSSLFLWIVFLGYIFEAFSAINSFQKGRMLKPVITIKSALLFLGGLAIEAIIIFSLFRSSSDLNDFGFLLVLFDILAPVYFSLLVLVFYPITLWYRNLVVEKATKKREQLKNIKVIGITGSYGKSSVKEFLGTILSQKFRTVKTPKNQNNEFGISFCILRDVKPEHQIFICEMGTCLKGGIAYLARIAKPDIGILTGINEQHMAILGSLKQTITTKFGLIASLPEQGIAIFNANNILVRLNANDPRYKVKKRKFCSTKEKLDIWAEDIRQEKEKLYFRAFSRDGDSASFELNLCGLQNVENILMAACCAKELGMLLGEISYECRRIKPEDSGISIIKLKNGGEIINSSYSANPHGVLAGLDYLKVYQGEKIVVMPCLIELGSASSEVHRAIGARIAKTCDLAIITAKDHFEDLRKGAMANGMKKEKILFIEKPLEILEKIKPFLKENNVVLLEGRVPTKLIDLLKAE